MSREYKKNRFFDKAGQTDPLPPTIARVLMNGDLSSTFYSN